jgi:hypothetical protein
VWGDDGEAKMYRRRKNAFMTVQQRLRR